MRATLITFLAAMAMSPGAAVADGPGDLDTTFVNPFAERTVYSVAVQGDRKVVIGGLLTTVLRQPRNGVARLNSDGTLDRAFGNPGVDNTVRSLAVQRDGKILIGGSFSQVGGQPRNGLARLNTDGTLDRAFGNPNASSGVNSLAVQGDGKVVVGGLFTTIGGQTRNYVARLNSDGTLDTGFGNSLANGSVWSVAVQGDGKILIGGSFSQLGPQGFLQARSGLARLNADGTLDTTFGDPGVDGIVRSIAVQKDGNILVGGDFSTAGGQVRSRVARINTDGTLDTTFVNPNVNERVNSVAVQGDGKVLIGGDFSEVGGQARSRLARINTDGTLDTTFVNPNVLRSDSIPGYGVESVWAQPDDRILIGGSFNQVGGQTRNAVARILGAEPCPTTASSASRARISCSPRPKVSVAGLTAKVSRSDAYITSRVTTPGAGRIVQAATTSRRVGSKRRVVTTTRCRVSRTATAAGTYTLKCNLGSKGRRALRKESLKLTVKTTLTPTAGAAISTERKLTIKRTR